MLATIAAAETQSFPATPVGVAETDDWIESIGKRWGVDERTVFRARVCVAELAANAIEHGKAPATDQITVELRHRPPRLEVEISDTGAAFDPVTAPLPEPDPERIGGRGLHLVRTYASTLAYRRNLDRNVVTLQLAPST